MNTTGLSNRSISTVYQHARVSVKCKQCPSLFPIGRLLLGYKLCLACGEKEAREKKHTVVPMPKSNYILVTDMALLRGLNSSHKGNSDGL
jgi:ribosomal protein L37AE/L43A